MTAYEAWTRRAILCQIAAAEAYKIARYHAERTADRNNQWRVQDRRSALHLQEGAAQHSAAARTHLSRLLGYAS